MPFDLPPIQAALRSEGFDGWLLYDFRGGNPLAVRTLGLSPAAHRSRRWFYFVPAIGEPRKLVHRIEPAALEGLPGAATLYSRWQELEAGLRAMLDGANRVAMEYAPRGGNPYVSRVDAGTVELVRACGAEVVSSGDLISLFHATLTDEQITLHLRAAGVTEAAYGVVWEFIADQVRRTGGTTETAVRDVILDHFRSHGLVTDHPPIVGVNANSGDPHHEAGSKPHQAIGLGDFVLVDLWAKVDHPEGIISDLTRVACVGVEPSAEVAAVFDVVAAARDAAIDRVRTALAAGRTICGWEVDRAAREVIDAAGHGHAFTHRTGHSIGRETHGDGTHMDDFETHDTRRILPRTLFSIEPGIYLPAFGVRSEVDVLIGPASEVRVTGGTPQTAVRVIEV